MIFYIELAMFETLCSHYNVEKKLNSQHTIKV